MALVKRKYLCKEINRHGSITWYYRKDKTSPRIRLPDNPDAPEFDTAYWNAFNGVSIDTKPEAIIKRYNQHTIDLLI